MYGYEPKPIDTSAVELPPGLSSLIEKLAEHNHDNWALQRIKEGWEYGPNRNDERRQHPGLVSYADLTESEKEYDRISVIETLRAIVACGWKILPDKETTPLHS